MDKNSPIPLYKQLAEELQKKINSGEFVKMPTIRTLAAEYGLNNATVVNAYKYLEKKQAVYSIQGSGIYVNTKTSIPQAPPPIIKQGYINFADTSVDPSIFPREEFQKSFEAVIARDGAEAFSHCDPRGYAPLREYISQLHDGNIQIISDINHGLNAALDALLNAGDSVIMEAPTSPALAAVFRQRRAKIHEAPITKDGIDLDNLTNLTQKHRPKIFFLMPTYQTPTNVCYTDDAKKYVLQLANKFNTYIIEVDSYGEFYYKNKPTPMIAMDNGGRVLYIKTFGSIFAANLLGYMVYPTSISIETSGASGYIQRGLDFYFKNFDYSLHTANVRAIFAQRYKRAIAATETFFSQRCTIFSASEGGLSLWLKGDYDTSNLKVIVSPGQFYSQSKYFRISFANATLDDISKGIGMLAFQKR